ncbi:MAG: haloacid dehalogenase, partial [Euryarchaeota archaeon]|nr:haloacid dehalogenase [Euryarchaeota archaeon]
MSTAVTFDSAGTLLHTIRVAYNICTDALLADVETTLLTYDDPDRVLCVLYMQIDQLMAASPST